MVDRLAASAIPGVADELAGQEAVRFAADLIRLDTTNHGGGDGREREAAEYVAERLAEAGLEPALLEAAPGRDVPRHRRAHPGQRAALLGPGDGQVPRRCR